MAINTIDPVSSLQFLVDSIPEWRTNLTALIEHTSQRHAEFVAEYSRLLNQARPKKQKSTSLHSLRSLDDKNDQINLDNEELPSRSATPQTPDFAEISPLEAGNRFLYAQTHRKRKPGTSLRSGASGPLRFRNKHMAVIYYDAYIQAELDRLVKNLGAARNNLRKGKMAYAAATGFKLPSLGRRYDHILPGMDKSRSGRSTSKIMHIDSNVTADDTKETLTGEAAFVKVDKELESMQNLCETAAHQAIRDGDCKLELDNAYKTLDALLPIATASLQSLKDEEEKRKKEEQERELRNSPRTREEISASSQSTLCDSDSIESINVTSKTLLPVVDHFPINKHPTTTAMIASTSAPQLSDTIEVDDDEEDEQSSIDLDIEAFRLANTSRRIRI